MQSRLDGKSVSVRQLELTLSSTRLELKASQDREGQLTRDLEARTAECMRLRIDLQQAGENIQTLRAHIDELVLVRTLELGSVCRVTNCWFSMLVQAQADSQPSAGRKAIASESIGV